MTVSIRTCAGRGSTPLAAAAVLVLGTFASAQDQADPDPTGDDPSLEEIVVTATRVPTGIDDLGGGIDVLRPDETALLQAGLAALLSDLPGVDVQGTFFGEKPTVNMRGMQGQFGTQRTLVLSDGVPLNDAYLGDADLRVFGTAMIDRVEVVRGPGSALYGKSAIGGVINLISRRGTDVPATEVSLMGGEYDTFGATVGHGARVGGFDYFVSAETLSTDGYITNSTDGSPRDWEGSSFGARLGLALGEAGELGLFARFGTGRGNREMYVEDADQGTYWLSYRFEPPAGQGSAFTARAYAGVGKRELAWKPAPVELYDQRTTGLQLQQELGTGGQHSVVFGADIRNDVVDVASMGGPVNADSTVSAGYVQDTIELEDNWALTLGARLDYEDDFGAEASPRVGLVRKLGEGDKLYASLGKGYRAPSASDLHLPPTPFGPFTYEGNPDLWPETHWSVEFGGSHATGERARLEWATFYDLGLDAWDYMQDPDTIFRPRNIARRHTFGVELQAEAELAQGVSLRAAYTFVRATYDEYVPDPAIEGNLVEDVPEHAGSVSLAKAWASGWAVEATTRFAGPRFTDPLNTPADELAGFAPMDLRLTAPLGAGVSLDVSVVNVFDKDYAVHVDAMSTPIPQPGRSVYACVRARF